MCKELQYRRFLPHWYVPGAVHFVTYRLAGTIPAKVMAELREERSRLLERESQATVPRGEYRARAHKQFFAKYDDYLAQATRIQWLADRRVAKVIRDNLYHHDGGKYHLLSYCIMCNHVHAVLLPIDPPQDPGGPLGARSEGEFLSDEVRDGHGPLSEITHSLKSYTAHEANKILNRTGRFWQPESYDHWVRDAEELDRIVTYVARNPVQAGLVGEPHEYVWCSAHDRFERDGTRSSWLLEQPP